MRRRMQLAVGSVLATIGAAGLIWTASLSRAGPEPAATSQGHEGMHRMMDAMHGPDAVNRMHGMPGGEEMMRACWEMMRAVDGMEPMMGGPGMMGDKMGGRP